MRKVYRLKHIPTGLYWVKKSYNHLSENGSMYTSGNHALSGLSPDRTIDVHVNDDRVVRKYLNVLSTIGEIRERPIEKWDPVKRICVPTGKTCMTWCMKSKVSDFKKEYLDVHPMSTESEPSVIQNNKEIIDDVTRVLVERVTRACWDQMFTISKDLMPYEDLLQRVKNQLNIK